MQTIQYLGWTIILEQNIFVSIFRPDGSCHIGDLWFDKSTPEKLIQRAKNIIHLYS